MLIYLSHRLSENNDKAVKCYCIALRTNQASNSFEDSVVIASPSIRIAPRLCLVVLLPITTPSSTALPWLVKLRAASARQNWQLTQIYNGINAGSANQSGKGVRQYLFHRLLRRLCTSKKKQRNWKVVSNRVEQLFH